MPQKILFQIIFQNKRPSSYTDTSLPSFFRTFFPYISKMSTLTALSLVLLGSTAASTINTRESRPNEHLMLVDCGIGLLPNGASTSREMAYYSGSYNPGGGNTKWIQPDMIANVPWDGSYPWRGSGVATKFPNGDTFQVWCVAQVYPTEFSFPPNLC